ncbi:MAG TPA: dihydrofolate reductase family protein [Mycobacterium sp.]|nr:dihydrofolate reductase family protein [Mycobacterium sp.]
MSSRTAAALPQGRYSRPAPLDESLRIVTFTDEDGGSWSFDFTELAGPADVVIAGESVVDIGAAVAALRRRGLRRILCEGGPTLLEELIARDLVDEMCLTISPTLAAAPTTARVGASRVPTRMALRHAVCIDDYVYLRYVRPGGGPDREVDENGSDAT